MNPKMTPRENWKCVLPADGRRCRPRRRRCWRRRSQRMGSCRPARRLRRAVAGNGAMPGRHHCSAFGK
jgi:hypothetical protein